MSAATCGAASCTARGSRCSWARLWCCWPSRSGSAAGSRPGTGGVPPYVPSWGNILAEGRLYLQQAPWLVLYPGAAIMLTIFGLNLLGDGLRDLLDPRLRGLVRERA